MFHIGVDPGSWSGGPDLNNWGSRILVRGPDPEPRCRSRILVRGPDSEPRFWPISILAFQDKAGPACCADPTEIKGQILAARGARTRTRDSHKHRKAAASKPAGVLMWKSRNVRLVYQPDLHQRRPCPCSCRCVGLIGGNQTLRRENKTRSKP